MLESTKSRDPWIVRSYFVYDATETLPVTESQAEALAFLGFIAYSPDDGPNGSFYRPCNGYTMDDVRGALA